MGLPPLEAMASGVPVVVSNRGALPETVGDAGVVVDPSDPEAFAGAVDRVLHDAALRQILRARGLQRAGEFSRDRLARQTAEVYRSVLGHL